jgi:glycosyltransferase involved in cell wall biosynthesis
MMILRLGGLTALRICLASFEYPPYIGGESSYTEGLATSLHDLGHEVTVLTARRDGGERFAGGVNVIELRTSPRRPARIASYQAAAAAYLSRHRAFDVVHQTNDYLFPLPSRRGVDLVTMHHPYAAEERLAREVLGPGEASRYLRRRNMAYLKAMQGMALRQMPEAVCVSRFTARSIGEQVGIPPDRLPVCPNGLHLAEFEGLTERETARDGLDLGFEHVLLHVGRLDHNKDLATLLEAFEILSRELPRTGLAIVGSGPLERQTRDQSVALGLGEKVRMLGKISRPMLLDCYAACDVAVLSTLMEGFGIVLAEAMAAGRPCVATGCGAVPEVVDDGRTGLLVGPRDPQGLAGALLALLSSPRLSSRLGQRGRRRAEALFDWPRVARRMLLHYGLAGTEEPPRKGR